MLAWMIYVVLVTLLVGLAALAAEKAARLRLAPSRWIWILAMVSSLLVPTMIVSVSVQVPTFLSPASPGEAIALRQVTSGALSPTKWIGTGANRALSSRNLDAWLRCCWIIASATLVLLLFGSSASLWWRKRSWVTSTVAGVSVYVASDIGPAVVGLLRPRIVVPNWLTELPDSQQALVIAHEIAHLKAGDPQAFATALCVLVCAPWNAPLWWQLRRLRHAIEVDCDAGVLRSGVEAKQYGETLLAVGQRQSASITTVAAMSEPRSFLEERITIMLRKPSKSWVLMAATFSCLSLTLIAVATQISPPESSSRPTESGTLPDGRSISGRQRVLVHLPSAVLDGYTGYYQYGEAAGFTTVKREGEHLMVEFPGLPPRPMYPESPTMFFGEDTDAQVSFTPDDKGQATTAALHQNGATTPMRRIDAATGEALRSAMEAKVRNQTPNPGSEAMLRRVIDGIVSGKPNLHEMNPQLAAAIHKDLPKLQVKLADLGAVQSIQLLSVSKIGMDVYEVKHERGSSQWSLALDSKGILVGAMVPL
ncbi:MAG: Signal transducer regulating beta-lactamase production, contains metallopeptidase domain [Gammaproteobacteria bacterium]|nr:Signal transducer regulating beta-lactamase production, contains metallopeptidase domain [Gammaproteobacteria bacterium]